MNRPLTAGGTLAALGVGLLTVLGALYGWTIFAVPFVLAVLFGFFLTSVALSRVGRARKRLLVDVPKSGPRNALQVLANGGVATLCALAAGALDRGGLVSQNGYALLWAFVGAYAAATADTWSTEIGSAFGGTPRSIVGFAPVARGLSGGVTLVGSTAMIAGAAWIALIWALPQGSWTAFWIVTTAGVAGALVDSLAGATLQELRRCPRCDRPTETAIHYCATPTIALRGIGWMSNDAVNALATVTGALVGAALFSLFR